MKRQSRGISQREMSDGAALTVKTLEMTLQIGRRFRELVEQRADARKIAAASFGHCDAPRQPAKQRNAQLILEKLHQSPDGIGRDVELGPRRFEATTAGRRLERADCVERRQSPAGAGAGMSPRVGQPVGILSRRTPCLDH